MCIIMFRVRLFLSLLLIGVVVDRKNFVLGGDADKENVTKTLYNCDPIKSKLWMSGPYDAIKGIDDGSNTTISNLTVNFTITDQDGCNFVGYHSWSNGEIGGIEYLAGSIIPPTGKEDSDDDVHFIMIEVGDYPDGGTKASGIDGYIDGLMMQWIYLGRNDVDTNHATAFTVFLAPGDADEDNSSYPSLPAMTLEDPALQCKDFSGLWISDPFTYYKIFSFGGDIDELPQTEIRLNLTQNGCFVMGTNSWKNNRGQSMAEYIVGIVDPKTDVLYLNELLQEVFLNGEIELSFSDKYTTTDGKEVLDMYFNGFGSYNNNETQASVFSAVFAQDEAPGLDNSDDSHQCDGDLIGVWKATTDATEVVVGNKGDVTFNDSNSPLSLEIVGQSENKCIFWGFGALGAPIVAQMFTRDDTHHITVLQIGPLTNGISTLKSICF